MVSLVEGWPGMLGWQTDGQDGYRLEEAWPGWLGWQRNGPGTASPWYPTVYTRIASSSQLPWDSLQADQHVWYNSGKTSKVNEGKYKNKLKMLNKLKKLTGEENNFELQKNNRN